VSIYEVGPFQSNYYFNCDVLQHPFQGLTGCKGYEKAPSVDLQVLFIVKIRED
jgi:hypothetical protein